MLEWFPQFHQPGLVDGGFSGDCYNVYCIGLVMNIIGDAVRDVLDP